MQRQFIQPDWTRHHTRGLSRVNFPQGNKFWKRTVLGKGAPALHCKLADLASLYWEDNLLDDRVVQMPSYLLDSHRRMMPTLREGLLDNNELVWCA